MEKSDVIVLFVLIAMGLLAIISVVNNVNGG